jgi:phosphoglycolate phosphatase
MNARSYELIIFDWDGTLMDSAATIVHCFERAYADAGVSYPGDAAVRRIIGLGLTEAIAALLPDADAGTRVRVLDGYRHYFLGLDAESMSLFPGVREGLAALTAQGNLLAIATGKSRRGLDRVLGHCGLGEYFVATRCADEAFSKPHPRMLEDILERTGMIAAQAVMVGDTSYDMLMAKAVNMAGLAVSYGVHAREELLQHGALACCESFDEVMTWLKHTPSQSARALRS